MKRTLVRAFPVFAEPAIGRYLGGQLASIVGIWTQNITLSLLLWETTHSPWLVGVLNFLLQGPMLFVPMLLGPRLHASTVRGSTLKILGTLLAVSALLFAGALAHRLSAPVLLAMAALLGLVSAMEWPARQLLLSASLQDRSLLVNALAMNALVFNVGRMAGPAVAAILSSQAGPAASFACCMLGISVVLVAIRGLPAPVVEAQAATTRPDLRAGLRFAIGNPFARRYLPMLACFGLLVSSYQTLIPALADVQFGSLSHYTGVFFAAAGAGAFTAAFTLSSLRRPEVAARALEVTPWTCATALAGIGLSSNASLTSACFFVIGLGVSLSSTQINSGLQHASPPELRGSVVGLYAMAFLGSMPLGQLLVGAVADGVGPRRTMLLMGASTVLFLGTVRWLEGRSGRPAAAFSAPP